MDLAKSTKEKLLAPYNQKVKEKAFFLKEKNKTNLNCATLEERLFSFVFS